MNLYSVFLKNIQPKKKIIFENQAYNYFQIFNFIENISKIIIKEKKNDIIFLISNNFFSYVILFYACSKLGKTLVPVNSSLSNTQILQILNFINPDMIFASNEFSFLKKNKKFFFDKIIFETLPKNILVRKKENNKYSKKNYIITFSSGTTAIPKPILFTQKIKYERYLQIKRTYNIKKKDNILLTSPVDHSLGQRIMFLATLTGNNLIFLKKYSKKKFSSIIQKENITFTILSSNYINLIKNELIKKKIKINKIVSAASTLSKKDKIDLKKNKIKLFEMYGAAEVGTITNLSLSRSKKENSVGKILSGCNVKIFNKNLKVLQNFKIGEIACKTNLKFKNYYKSFNLTKKSFKDGYFLTGDLGYKDNNNYLYFVSRIKDVIISSGENIYPSDIEKEALKYNNIHECCAIGVPDKYFGEALYLVCVLKKKRS